MPLRPHRNEDLVDPTQFFDLAFQLLDALRFGRGEAIRTPIDLHAFRSLTGLGGELV